MMQNMRLTLVGLSLSLLTLAGCGVVPATPVTPVATTQPAANVVDSLQGGTHTATVNVFAAEDGGYAAQSIVHRWVRSDIQQYDVTLSVGSTALSTTSVYLIGGSGAGKIAFTHLKNNVTYTVSVVAKGANGYVNGGAQQVINAQKPASGLILFSGSNDIENTQAISISVKLDDVVFDGSATSSVTTTDASYLNPTATESVQAGLQVYASVGYNAWGWDIANTSVRNLDMAPILCSDGKYHTPNTFKAYPLDGTLDLTKIHAAYPNWFDATTGNGSFEWWMYAGQWRQYGVKTVGVKAAYDDGNGVTGTGPQQATTTFVN